MTGADSNPWSENARQELTGHARALVIVSGPLAAMIVLAALTTGEALLTQGGRLTLAVAAWMACWWLTEAVPLAATALLPLVLFPLLDIGSVDVTAAPYANSLVFLFMGGFLIGLAMQRFGLHRRVALVVLRGAGNDTRRLLGAFMVVTALLSMWISNTATAIMLLPIASSLIASVSARAEEGARAGSAALGTALMLAIAYSASIGGTATLVGSPPNLILAAFLREQFDVEMDMLRWLAVGGPFALVMLPCTWLYLTRIAFRNMPARLAGSRALFTEQLRALGSLSRGERVTLGVFSAAVMGWLLRPWIVAVTGITGLSDAVVAMTAGLVLFVIPVAPGWRIFAMDWETARQLPWQILILFGGGLTLAGAISRHGVDAWLASALEVFAGAPIVLVVLALCTLVVFLTEITSNTAVTATLLPVVASSATAIGVSPEPLLLATAIAASCAFMLPVATPPNAIVFASGAVTIKQMARAGFALNLTAIVLVTLVVSVFGTD